MAPTLVRGENLLVDMRDRRAPSRGTVVLIETAQNPWIKRVVAVAGDRIAMVDGIPIINGKRVLQVRAGVASDDSMGTVQSGQRSVETLSGEVGNHAVLDLGKAPQDNFPETVVPTGQIFVMGDNRDSSMDSRFPRELGGVGMVSTTMILGRPLFIYWSAERARIGTRLNP